MSTSGARGGAVRVTGAGTADARVPARDEAERVARSRACRARGCRVHLVEGAGHAGALDGRVDLRAVMDAWRREDLGQEVGGA